MTGRRRLCPKPRLKGRRGRLCAAYQLPVTSLEKLVAFNFQREKIMRAVFLISFVLLTGCSGGGMYTVMETTPGSALPSGIAVCNKRDQIGRCKEWSSRGNQCVNPKGINEPNPVIPCATIRMGN
jgi:hypothetical protein